jgi:hypothetical protein
MGVLMLVAEDVFLQGVDLRDPSALSWRNPYIASQLVISGAAVYGALRSDVYRFVLTIVAVVDSLTGIGLSIAGWVMLDGLVPPN